MNAALEQLEGFPKLVGAAALSPEGTLLGCNPRCCFPPPVMTYLGDGMNSLMGKLQNRGLPATHGCVELGKLVLFFALGKECHLLALFQNSLTEGERAAFLQAVQDTLPGFHS